MHTEEQQIEYPKRLNSKKWVNVLPIIYIVCFFIGGLRHWLDIAAHGVFPYKTIPFIFNFYLTSLAILDWVVILLLLIKPLYGLLLAIVIMSSDILIDLYLGYTYWNIGLSNNIGLQLLLIFTLFIFFTAPLMVKKYE